MHLNLHSICQKFSRLLVYRPVKMCTTCISVVSKLLSSYHFCIQIQGIGDKGFMVDRSIYSWIIYIYTVFMIYKFITFIWMVGTEVLLFVLNLCHSLSDFKWSFLWVLRKKWILGEEAGGSMILWYWTKLPPLYRRRDEFCTSFAFLG